MPDIREVYEMVTKQKSPEPGALERQQKRQVRAARNKRNGAFAVAAVIAVVAVVLILEARERPNATTPAKQPSTVAPVPASGAFFLHLQTGERTPLAKSLSGGFAYVASPDGTRIAYGSSSGGGCAALDVVTVANIDGTHARTLQSPGDLIYCAARWSPDGTKLVYQERVGPTRDVGNLFVQDLSSGERTQLTDLQLSKAWWWFLSPSFSPDGRNVIFQLPRTSSQTTKWDVWSVPVTGGEPTLVVRNGTFPMYFPDGKEIAFASPMSSDFAGHSISIADAQGSRRTLVEANTSIWWPTMSPDGSRIAYQDGGSIYVVDVSTGESSKVADGDTAEWLDNDTLIVAPQ